jgi:hypothetical protein
VRSSNKEPGGFQVAGLFSLIHTTEATPVNQVFSATLLGVQHKPTKGWIRRNRYRFTKHRSIRQTVGGASKKRLHFAIFYVDS